jgi:YfiH family protein
LKVFVQDHRHVYLAPALQELEWLEHGFGTKLSHDWAAAERLAQLKQIHSARVVVADGRTGFIGDGDALITDRPGLLLGIRTADCLPILIVDPRHRAVAAVHAGWRGTIQKIGSAALQALHDHFGSRPEDVIVAIGHGIGVCCYEVGPEVARQFEQYFPQCANLSTPAKIDLAKINLYQFCDAGVPAKRISVSGICTRCTPEMDSYRRDGEHAGRMLAAVGVREG